MKQVWLLALVMVACSSKTDTVEHRIDNVVRVYMHEPNWYTFDTQEPESPVVKSITLRTHFDKLVRLTDVPLEKPMWVKYATRENGCNGYMVQAVEIHLHSVRDINGAGWNHSKSGHGQTTVVE